MRNLIFSILFLCGLAILPTEIRAQEKLLTLPEAETQLREAERNYAIAKDAYKNASKADQDTTRKIMRAASREVGRCRMEIFKIHKRNYLCEKAGLTEKEATAFFPVYEEMQHQLFHLQDESQHAIKRLTKPQKTFSEKDYRDAVTKKIEAGIQIAQLQKEYFERFMTILPAQKVVLLFDAEARFSQEMMRHESQKGGETPAPQPGPPVR
ncbi:MAG: hypothetical protein LUI04_00665 [Porphyromonadaceae bacterium]|nr:hypothetical protein [Porphyromonadaceae bacterium]